MRVTMKTRIGGYRNGQEWPAPGGHIDVPDHEGRDLIAAGYAEAAEVPTIDIARARKADLLDHAAAIGVDVDPKAPVAEIRAALTGGTDETPSPEPDGDPAEQDGQDQPDEADDPAAVEAVGLEDLDKGQLLDLAADLNISVNPALDAGEIRAALTAAQAVTGIVGERGPELVQGPAMVLPPPGPLEA